MRKFRKTDFLWLFHATFSKKWPDFYGKNINKKWVFLNFLIFGWKYKKMIVTSFVYLQKVNNFPKFGRCGSKIRPTTPI